MGVADVEVRGRCCCGSSLITGELGIVTFFDLRIFVFPRFSVGSPAGCGGLTGSRARAAGPPLISNVEGIPTDGDWPETDGKGIAGK